MRAVFEITMEAFRVNAIIIGAVVILVQLINVIVGGKNLKEFSNPLKWLVIYLFFSLCCEFLSSLYFINKDSNLWIINLYTIGEFISIAIIFTLLTQKTIARRNLFYSIIALIVLGYLIYFLFVKSFFNFSSYSETLENLFLMGFCFYFFMYSLSEKPICKDEETKLVNWFAIGLFIYLSGTVLIWLAYDFFEVRNFRDFKYLLIYSNGFLNFSFKVIVLIALLSYDHRIRRKNILGYSKRELY